VLSGGGLGVSAARLAADRRAADEMHHSVRPSLTSGSEPPCWRCIALCACAPSWARVRVRPSERISSPVPMAIGHLLAPSRGPVNPGECHPLKARCAGFPGPESVTLSKQGAPGFQQGAPGFLGQAGPRRRGWQGLTWRPYRHGASMSKVHTKEVPMPSSPRAQSTTPKSFSGS
jgi:hypothetical protein